MDNQSHSDNHSPDEPDQPITALALLDLKASPGFWARVRKKIDRRVAAIHFMSFSWNLPKLVFIEFLDMAFHLFTPARGSKGGSR